MKTIAVVNGPNLNRLGKREPHIYGSTTLAELEAFLRQEAEALAVELRFHQSNHEGDLVDLFSEMAEGGVDGVILNAAAYTHTSVALRDAVAGSGLKVVEVHISNIYKREEFRHHSYTASMAVGMISGLGLKGYSYALEFLAKEA